MIYCHNERFVTLFACQKNYDVKTQKCHVCSGAFPLTTVTHSRANKSFDGHHKAMFSQVSMEVTTRMHDIQAEETPEGLTDKTSSERNYFLTQHLPSSSFMSAFQTGALHYHLKWEISVIYLQIYKKVFLLLVIMWLWSHFRIGTNSLINY